MVERETQKPRPRQKSTQLRQSGGKLGHAFERQMNTESNLKEERHWFFVGVWWGE